MQSSRVPETASYQFWRKGCFCLWFKLASSGLTWHLFFSWPLDPSSCVHVFLKLQSFSQENIFCTNTLTWVFYKCLNFRYTFRLRDEKRIKLGIIQMPFYNLLLSSGISYILWWGSTVCTTCCLFNSLILSTLVMWLPTAFSFVIHRHVTSLSLGAQKNFWFCFPNYLS